MGARMTLCFICMGLIAAVLVLFWKIFRRKLIFREVATGALVYVVGRMFIYQSAFAFVVQAMGEKATAVSRGVAGTFLDTPAFVPYLLQRQEQRLLRDFGLFWLGTV